MSELNFEQIVKHLDDETKEWTNVAARGNTPWVCADCGATCLSGMPVDCVYGHQYCTDILKRDRALAGISSDAS